MTLKVPCGIKEGNIFVSTHGYDTLRKRKEEVQEECYERELDDDLFLSVPAIITKLSTNNLQ